MTRLFPLQRTLQLGVVIALLGTLLGAVAPTAAGAAPDPTRDIPRLPARCLEPGQIIPQTPGACRVTRFVQSRPTVVLWGDSHAWQYIPALRVRAHAEKVNLVAFFMGACPPIAVDPPARGERLESSCEKSNVKAARFVRRLKDAGKPVRVVLAANWVGYREVLANPTAYDEWVVRMAELFDRDTPRLFRALAATRVSTHVVAQAATVPRPRPAACPEGRSPYVCDIPRAEAIPDEERTRRWLRSRMKPLPRDSRYIDPSASYCDATVCHGKVGWIYTFYDDLHLSATRSRKLDRYFVRTFRGIR